jgi:hypothetical protein
MPLHKFTCHYRHDAITTVEDAYIRYMPRYIARHVIIFTCCYTLHVTCYMLHAGYCHDVCHIATLLRYYAIDAG